MNYEIKSAREASNQEIFRDKNNRKKLSYKNERGVVREILDGEDLTTLNAAIAAVAATVPADASEVSYDNATSGLPGTNVQDAIDDVVVLATQSSASGVVIDFSAPKVFNDAVTEGTGNITDNLTDAKIGVVQKIYHNDGSAPTVPAGWVLIGSGTYTTSSTNIIYAEYCGGTRVEYWIVTI